MLDSNMRQGDLSAGEMEMDQVNNIYQKFPFSIRRETNYVGYYKCPEDKWGWEGNDWKEAALMRVVREDFLEEVRLS